MFQYMFGARHKLTTLGELQRAGRAVYCRCKACRHENNLAPGRLIPRFGADARVTWTANFMRCSRCGSRDVFALPGDRPRHPARMPPPIER